MRRTRYHTQILIGMVMVSGILSVPTTTALGSTPNPNSAVIQTRVFNDCPASGFFVANNYPAQIVFDEVEWCNLPANSNLHIWRYSDDGSTAVDFDNNASFTFGCELVIDSLCTGYTASGLQISPWYNNLSEGRFEVLLLDTHSDIRAYGGRLPSYNFTTAYGLHYVRGTSIFLQMTYQPHSNSSIHPGTIQYRVVYGGDYSSAELPFDRGDLQQGQTYGNWGILNQARVGGHYEYLLHPSWFSTMRSTFKNIFFDVGPVPVAQTSWGKVKSLYK